MRLSLFVVAAIAVITLPKEASADVIDDFALTGNGLDITFSLPASTTVAAHAAYNYYVFQFTEIRNGIAQPGSIGMTIEGDPCGADGSQLDGIALCTFGRGQIPSYTALWNYFFVALPPPTTIFFTGYDTFTFNPGTYPIMDIDHNPCIQPGHPSPCYLQDPQYTLTITPEGTSGAATPEPATFTLLSTGLASGLVMSRSRFAKR